MLLGLLYRIIGDFSSYIGDIGDTIMAAIASTGTCTYSCARIVVFPELSV